MQKVLDAQIISGCRGVGLVLIGLLQSDLVADFRSLNMIVSKENRRVIYQNLFKGALYIPSTHCVAHAHPCM